MKCLFKQAMTENKCHICPAMAIVNEDSQLTHVLKRRNAFFMQYAIYI